MTIGVTGAPGTGKSTLIDGLSTHYRKMGKRLGIIAVDPSSPFSGGAILGDRIRMQSRSADSGTYIRSMATRGHLGGLSRAGKDVVLVMDAAGFDIVLIETVGVGQDEVEIVRTAHTTLVLLVPGMGDDIQTMKAGIMEIGDIFVINKADHVGVDRLEGQLQALLSLGTRRDGWIPRVVRTVASAGEGMTECIQAISEYGLFQSKSPLQRDRSIQIHKDRLLELASSRLLRHILDAPQAGRRIEELARRVADRQIDPFSAAEELLKFPSGDWEKKEE